MVEACVFIVALSTMVVSLVLLLVRHRGSRPSKLAIMACISTGKILCLVHISCAAIWFDVSPTYFYGAVALNLALIPSDWLLFSAMDRMEQAEMERVKSKMVLERLEAQQAYKEDIDRQVLQARQIGQAMLVELEGVGRDLRAHKGLGVEEGLNRAVELAGASEWKICENSAVAAVLFLKGSVAQSLGIKVKMETNVPADLLIDSTELCAVFSNLMDNAISALAGVEVQRRFLILRSRVNGSFLVIEVRNSRECCAHADGDVKGSGMHCEDGLWPSEGSGDECRSEEHRPDADRLRGGARQLRRHGWGLEIVGSIATRYGGHMQVAQTPDSFDIRVVLSLCGGGAFNAYKKTRTLAA